MNCKCECHQDPDIMHFDPCCNNTYKQMNTITVPLSFQDYQKGAASTAQYPYVGVDPNSVGECGNCESENYIYPALGLCGEAGEVAEKVKKIVRDKLGTVDDISRAAVAKELGDCLWYIAALCKEFKLDMGEVAQGNLNKLAARKAAGTIQGSGDER